MIRFLDREAEITTRYGGGFVQSIDGTAGGVADGRSHRLVLLRQRDRVARAASAEVAVRGGDRIWWDYRDWTAAISHPGRGRLVARAVPAGLRRTPAEPARGERRLPRRRAPSAIDVSGALAERRRRRAGRRPGDGRRRRACGVLVGTWARLRSDAVAARARPTAPATSGVFARFEPAGGGWRLAVLDRHGSRGADARRRRRPRRAACATATSPATWVVTGTDAAGVERARPACSTPTTSHQRYAVATDGGRRIPVPAADERMRSPIAYAPRPGPLASAGALAATAYLGVARGGRLRLLEPDRARRGRRRRSRSPGSLAGARDALAAAAALGPGARGAGDRRQRDRLAARRHDPAPRRRAAGPRPDRRQRRGAGRGRGPGPADRGRALLPSPCTPPASTPTGCCGCCGRSPATRRSPRP